MDEEFGFGVPAEDLRRLKPYLAKLEERLNALEAKVTPAEAKAQAKADAAELKAAAAADKSPDPQTVASDAMKAFVDVTDKQAAPPAKDKA